MGGMQTSSGQRSSLFDRGAIAAAHASGTSGAFAFAAFVVVGWAASGPWFEFSETWQLVINTGTTIITFLMVFFATEQAIRRHHHKQSRVSD